MKFILLFAFLGTALCAPHDMYMEFDIHHAPAEAAQAIPAGAAAGTLEVLLPVDAQRQLIGGSVRGFIKQDIPQPNGKDEEVFYPFGFDQPAPAAAAPAAADPVVVAPVVVAPAVADPVAAAPAAPVVAIVAVAPPAPTGDDDDDDD